MRRSVSRLSLTNASARRPAYHAAVARGQSSPCKQAGLSTITFKRIKLSLQVRNPFEVYSLSCPASHSWIFYPSKFGSQSLRPILMHPQE